MTARIVIIGGGCSGAVVALNLLRRFSGADAEITLVEPRPLLGGGVAYSSQDKAHRLNVPAARMLVLSETPLAFEDWFKAERLAGDPEARLEDGRLYPRRSAFGEFLDFRLRAEAAAPGAMKFRHVRAAAEAVSPEGRGFSVRAGDAEIPADYLVLAVSHPPPAVPKPLREIAGAKKFIENPWLNDALGGIEARDRVLVIGTALSTADVIASLKAQGHTGEMLAVSRRGLVSRLRKMAQAEPFGDFSTAPEDNAITLLRRIRATIVQAEASGSSWGAVIDAIRVQGLVIWSALPEAEKARVLRHLRTFWDVHRYQVAPQLAAITEEQCAAGKLALRAARILGSRVTADGRFAVGLKFRGEAAGEQVFDAVINCTGPDHGHVVESNAALASLHAAGLVERDAFGLGVKVDLTARALNAAGVAHPRLFVAGPLARATFGELMGLPQVTQHAGLVAEEIGGMLAPVGLRAVG